MLKTLQSLHGSEDALQVQKILDTHLFTFTRYSAGSSETLPMEIYAAGIASAIKWIEIVGINERTLEHTRNLRLLSQIELQLSTS